MSAEDCVYCSRKPSRLGKHDCTRSPKMNREEVRDKIARILGGDYGHYRNEYLDKADQVLSLPEIKQALDYYDLMHTPPPDWVKDIEKIYKE